MARILFEISLDLELVLCLHNEVFQVENILRSTELFLYILYHEQEIKDNLRLMKEDKNKEDETSRELKESWFSEKVKKLRQTLSEIILEKRNREDIKKQY